MRRAATILLVAATAVAVVPAALAKFGISKTRARPRPSRVKEVRIAVEEGIVRLDNVALSVR